MIHIHDSCYEWRCMSGCAMSQLMQHPSNPRLNRGAACVVANSAHQLLEYATTTAELSNQPTNQPTNRPRLRCVSHPLSPPQHPALPYAPPTPVVGGVLCRPFGAGGAAAASSPHIGADMTPHVT